MAFHREVPRPVVHGPPHVGGSARPPAALPAAGPSHTTHRGAGLGNALASHLVGVAALAGYPSQHKASHVGGSMNHLVLSSPVLASMPAASMTTLNLFKAFKYG